MLRSTAQFADHVGLARTTVSRVLNGQPGLKQSTIDRVQRALAETGFNNPNVSGIWFGLIAPPGTPKPLREKLAKDISEILKTPEIAQKASDTGYELIGNTPDQFGAFLQREQQLGAQALKGRKKSD